MNTQMNTLVNTNLQFTFTQFTDLLIAEIWMENMDTDQYCGEIVLFMN